MRKGKGQGLRDVERDRDKEKDRERSKRKKLRGHLEKGLGKSILLEKKLQQAVGNLRKFLKSI